MGHYLSEMQTDHQVDEEERQARERRRKLVNKISADLEKRGIAEVLADIVDDPQMYRLRMR